MYQHILLAVCLVLFFIIMFLLQGFNCEDNKIQGFWIVSDQFKEQANLEQFLIYIGEGDGYLYKGYIVINSEGESLYNNAISFRIAPK